MLATPKDLQNAWNVNRGEMLACGSLDIKNRFQLSLARLQEVQDLFRWVKAIKRAADSEFCTGRISPDGRLPFVGSFDWLIRPDTLVLIEEGQFDDRGAKEVIPPDSQAPADLSYFNDPKPSFSLTDKEIMDAQIIGIINSYNSARKRTCESMGRGELESIVIQLRKSGALWTPNQARKQTGHP